MTTHPTTADAIDALLGSTAAAVAELRAARPVTRDESQSAYEALFTQDSPGASAADKQLVAVFVSELHRDTSAADHYGALATGTDASTPVAAVREAARAASVRGPYGDYSGPVLAGESVDGPEYAAPAELARAVGDKLAAALAHAHFLVFHPRDAVPERLAELSATGWNADGIVSLAQTVAFLSYQLRAVAGLRVLAGETEPQDAPDGEQIPTRPRLSPQDRTDRPDGAPDAFTSDQLDWLPWVEPPAEDDLTDQQREALIDRARANNPYFRLLARDPEVLRHRTLADKDIFYNTEGGLARAERELAAAAASRTNGCLYCASVHSRFAAHFSKRDDEVQRLLDEGMDADQEPVWAAVIAASAHLTATPIAFGPADVAALSAAGLGPAESYDVIHAAAFFNWANRLMLTLGEPVVPS